MLLPLLLSPLPASDLLDAENFAAREDFYRALRALAVSEIRSELRVPNDSAEETGQEEPEADPAPDLSQVFL